MLDTPFSRDTFPHHHRHRSAKHRNVCHSTKYMMLHVRDCSGLLSNGDVCPFPWCRKTKHLLYHLVSCKDGSKCSICNPEHLPSNLSDLVSLNAHRRKIFIDRVTKAKAAMQSTPSNHRPSPLKSMTTGTSTQVMGNATQLSTQTTASEPIKTESNDSEHAL